MLAKFIKYDDPRLSEIADFEVLTIQDDGEIHDTNWHDDTTYNKLFDMLILKHRKGIEVSVLDYGDELRATVTANARTVKHHYVIIML